MKVMPSVSPDDEDNSQSYYNSVYNKGNGVSENGYDQNVEPDISEIQIRNDKSGLVKKYLNQGPEPFTDADLRRLLDVEAEIAVCDLRIKRLEEEVAATKEERQQFFKYESDED